MVEMKLNWGTGIVITIIIFLLISFAMIFHFMNQKVDLVTDNYYEKTLVYQKNIDEAERSREFDKDIKFEYSNNKLKFIFPDSVAKAMNDGAIYFYRPSDSAKDFKTHFYLDEKSEMMYDLSKIEKGYWKVQIKWLMNEETYSVERTVMVN
jgi:hypothetical protein